jgi:hypothetical protein
VEVTAQKTKRVFTIHDQYAGQNVIVNIGNESYKIVAKFKHLGMALACVKKLGAD